MKHGLQLVGVGLCLGLGGFLGWNALPIVAVLLGAAGSLVLP